MEEPRIGSLERFMRRRRFLVDPELQFRLLGVSLGHVLFTVGLGAACLFGPAGLTLLQSAPGSEAGLESAGRILYLHGAYWPAGLLALVAICLDSIRVSHRIAGPLYRFRRLLGEVVHERPTSPIQLRRGDFLEREAREVNDALVELEKKRGSRAEARRSCAIVAEGIRAAAGEAPRCIDSTRLLAWASELDQASAAIGPEPIESELRERRPTRLDDAGEDAAGLRRRA